MVEYTGEDWQKDILSRDWLDSYCLIDNIAGRLYKGIYSSEQRKQELLKIPEMKRLNSICKKECIAINKLRGWGEESNTFTIENRSIDPKEKGMNEHVKQDQGAVAPVLDVVEHPVEERTVFVQDDSDYPVDPLDRPFEDGVNTSGNEVPANP